MLGTRVKPLDVLLILGALVLGLRVFRPWTTRPGGVLVRRDRLPLLARIRFYRLPAVVVLGIGVVGVIVGWFSPWGFGLAFIVVGILIALPIVVVLTDEGIALGRTPLRRWTEFGGVVRRRGGARLQGITNSPSLTIWLSDSRDDDEFVYILRQLVRGSYKGDIGPGTRKDQPISPSATGTGRSSFAPLRQ